MALVALVSAAQPQPVGTVRSDTFDLGCADQSAVTHRSVPVSRIRLIPLGARRSTTPLGQRVRRHGAATTVAITAAGVLTLAAPMVGFAGPGPHVLAGGRLIVTLANPAAGPATTSDRVDAISWTNSTGVAVTNLVSNGGSSCGDVREFFGQSYGFPEGAVIYPVVAGSSSTWSGTSLSGTALTSGTWGCGSGMPVAKTQYTVYGASDVRRNELKVQRTFTFTSTPTVWPGAGLRSYVPRLPLSVYPLVAWPNAAGVVTTANSGGCGADCGVTDWNGRWLALESSSGTGVVILRDFTSRAPAELTINNDAISASNLSSMVLIQPTTGWKGTVTETEWLCFYDATSWPVKKAGNQPAGCAIPANTPTSVVVTAGSGSATAAFGAPTSNGGAPVTSYLVTATPVAGGIAITKSGTASPITVTGLAHGAAYKVTVQAINAAGKGRASTAVTVTAG